MAQELNIPNSDATTLLVWGDADSLVSREDQEALRDALPRADLVVYDGVGHTPHWEAPARFAADVVKFAESLS